MTPQTHRTIRLLHKTGIALIALPFLGGIGLRKDYRKGCLQRVGWYPSAVRRRLAQKCRPRVWVDAVSIGEMQVALHFFKALKQRWPELELVLTTQTPEGLSLAEQRKPAGVELLQFPLDAPWSLHRAFELIRPDFIVLVETNLWPNHLEQAAARNVPVFLINARMSPSDARWYRWGGTLVRHIFGVPGLVCAQGSEDAERLCRLGVPPPRLHVTGNIKFDVALTNPNLAEKQLDVASFLRAASVPSTRPILVAGSTHPGEEDIFFQLVAEWKTREPSPMLVLAPRNIKRASQLATRARRRNLAVRIRSEPDSAIPQDGQPTDCLILDTLGELPSFYRAATVSFVGGSLVSHGGHNLMEAAAAGPPVLFGPNMENFRAVADQFLATGGAVQVRDATELRAMLERLLLDASERDRISRAARQVILANTGATEQTLELVLNSLVGPSSAESRLEIARAEIGAADHPATHR